MNDEYDPIVEMWKMDLEERAEARYFDECDEKRLNDWIQAAKNKEEMTI